MDDCNESDGLDDSFRNVEEFVSHANDPNTLAKERALFKQDESEKLGRNTSANFGAENIDFGEPDFNESPFEDIESFLSKLDDKRESLDNDSIRNHNKDIKRKEVFPGAYRISGVGSTDTVDVECQNYKAHFGKQWPEDREQGETKSSEEAIVAECVRTESSEISSCSDRSDSINSSAEPKKKRKTTKMIFIVLAIVVVLAIGLGVGFSLKNNDQPQLKDLPAEKCEHASTEEFSMVLKRCLCNEGLSDIPANQIDDYNMIKEDFLKNNILRDFDYNTTSCELPNIALHWLAEHSSKISGFMDDNLSERYALALFFLSFTENTNYDGWKSRSGWMTETSVCDWFGITCDENGEVTHIVLQGNRLNGEIPGEISLLRRLKTFDLSDNSVTGFIPTELGLLTEASRIVLRNTEIEGTIPNEIGQLTLLQYLDLAFNNDLSGYLPTTLGSCTSLEVLDIEFADLSGTIPTEFGRLDKLEILQLSTNPVKGSIPTYIGLCTSLRELLMFNCNVSGSIPSEIGKLSNLEKLSVSRSNLSGSIPPAIFHLPRLQELILSYSQLNGSIPPIVGLDQTQLQTLNLRENNLSGSIPTELSSLSNLLLVDIALNRLKGSIPSELGLLTNLTQLTISHNDNIQGTIPWELGNLSNLEIFDFSWTSLKGTVPLEICELPNLTTLEENCCARCQ